MEITKREPVEKFTVKAGFELGIDKKLEMLAFQLGDTEIKLNAEQCEELFRVLEGKKCYKVACYEAEGSYNPHSILHISAHENE